MDQKRVFMRDMLSPEEKLKSLKIKKCRFFNYIHYFLSKPIVVKLTFQSAVLFTGMKMRNQSKSGLGE